MIDIEKAKEIFEEYTNEYDLTQVNYKRKKEHSLRVAALSKMIANSIGEDEDLAELIGLFHDISRFEQLKRFNSTSDLKTGFDHGYEGEKLIKEKGWLEKISDDRQIDDIVYKAIRNHNQRIIEEGLSEKELLFAKLIRDADKLDLFKLMNTEYLDMLGGERKTLEEIKNQKIAYESFKEIMACRQLDSNLKIDQINEIMVWIGFLFDINFKISFRYLAKNKYIERLINIFKGGRNDELLNQIQDVVYEYIRINY